MGLIRGSGSFTRFLVDGSLPQNYLEEFPKRISRFAFRNLDEASEQERSVGWVNIMDMFDSQFVAREYFKDPCIALSWRVDMRKVPSNALVQHCREAEEKIKAADKLEFLPKTQRQEIKEMVRVKLLKRAIPRSNVYDTIWNLRNGVVIFGSTSSGICDEFAEFFLNCFDLHLKSIFPYFLASQFLEKEGLHPDLLDILQSSIVAEVK